MEDDIREKVLYNGRKLVPWIAYVLRDKWEKGSGGNFGSNESSFHSHKCFFVPLPDCNHPGMRLHRLCLGDQIYCSEPAPACWMQIYWVGRMNLCFAIENVEHVTHLSD